MRTALFVIVLVAVGAAFAYVSGLSFSTYGPTDCASAGIDCSLTSLSPHDSGFQGYGCTGGVCSTSPTGPGYPGNLIRWSTYISSWDPAGFGQQVVVQGGIALIPGYWNSCGVDVAHYTIVLNWIDGSGTWHADKVVNTDVAVPKGLITSGVQTTAEVDWVVQSPDGRTILSSGDWIHASFSVHCAPILGVGGGWYEEAAQNSLIVTGIGAVNWQKGQYIVGQAAAADYHVGFVNDPQSGKSEWTIYITSGAQGGATVYGPVALTQTDGTVYYTVQAADFNINGNPGTNFLVVHLKNMLFSKSWDKTTTISQAALAFAPKCSITGFGPATPLQGQTVTLNFTCTPAGTDPNAVIQFIEVDWGYGSIDATHMLAANAVKDTFVAGSSGYLRAEVIAWAGPNGGTIPSPTAKVDINVGNQPTANNNPPPGGGLPIWVVLVFIAIVAGAVSVLVPSDLFGKLKIRPFSRLVGLIVAVSLAVVAYLVFPR